MKILVIADLPPYVTGGAEMQALRLIDAWLEEGHDIQCIGRHLPKIKMQREHGIVQLHPIQHIKKLGRPIKAISYFISLAYTLFKLKKWPDIIYTRFLGDAAITASFLKNIGLINNKLVSTPANAGKSGDLSYVKSAPFADYWISLLNRQCNAINLIAPEMLQDLHREGLISPQISHIPNGIPVQKKFPPKTQKSDHRLVFVSVGRLSAQKGYDLFIEALSQCKTQHDDSHFMIIGDGPERHKLNTMIEKFSLSKKVTLCGELSQDEIKHKLRDADIFFLPSRYEGMSNAALEAMESQLPVLLTHCGGIDTYIDENMGWLALPNDVGSLKTSLENAMSCDPQDLQKMGIINREFVIKNFDMNIIARKYLSLFDNLLSNTDSQHHEI